MSSHAYAQTCSALTPTTYPSSQVILNLDANFPESVFDVNGNDATNGSFNGLVNEWRNAEDLIGGPSLTAPGTGTGNNPQYVVAPTTGDADNYILGDGVNDTLQYTANLTNQSFTVYFALQSFLNPAQNHQYKSFVSTGTNPNVAGTWQLDMSTGGAGQDNCATTNYFSWRVNDGGPHFRLCGRPLDNNVHSFYLTYSAVTKEAKFFMDGVLFDSRIVNNQINIDLIKLFRNRAGASYQNARIYEFGMLNFAETDFSDLAEYLNCKWGTVSDDMDIEVSMTPSVVNPNLGQTVTYTVNVFNNGPNGASDIDVSSLVPAGLTYVPGSIAGGGSRNGSSPTGVGLRWTANPLLSGESDTLTFQATVNSGTEGQLISSSASITDYIGLDTDTANNVNSTQIRVQGVDLSVSKSVNSLAPGLGQEVEYTITVSNLGTDPATGVTLTDDLDARLDYTASSATGGVSRNDTDPNGGGIVWNLGTINPGQTFSLTFRATPNTAATIPNTASITTVDQPEGDVSNNSGSQSIAVGAIDLNVAFSASSTVVNEGQTVTFTTVVTNVSSDTLTSGQIRSIIPIGLSYVASSIAGGSSNNDSAPFGSGLRWNLPAMGPGATQTLTYQITVNPGAAINYGTRTVSASLFTSNPGDQNPANNSSNSTLTIVNFDAGITKTASPTTAAEGETVTYTLTVRNDQENVLNNILVRDIIPAGLTYVSGSWASSIAGTTVNESDPEVAGVRFTIPQLQELSNAPLNQAVITFDVTIDAGAASSGAIQNTGRILSLDENDTNPANDSSSVSITPITFDAGIAQIVSNNSPEEGETVLFTITVTNNNASAVGTNIEITNVVPNGMTYVPGSISIDNAPDASDPTVAGLKWVIASLAGGAAETVTFEATVDAGAKSAFSPILNTALISNLDQVDSVASNNSAPQTLTITGLDLSVTKAVDVNDPIEGQEILYTITVTNNSSQPATNVVIADVVPNGVTYVASSALGGAVNETTPDSGTGLTWTVPTLAGTASVDVTFRATVDAGAFTNTPSIQNTASFVSANESEENPANNSGSVTINIKSFDVEVQKSVNNTTPEEGEEVTYSILVTNSTIGVAGTNIVITDVVPDGVTYVPGSISAAHSPVDTDPDGAGLTWTIASLAAGGGTETLTFRATVDSGAKDALGTVTNTAEMTSLDQTDSITSNNSDDALITIVGLDIGVAISASPLDPVEGSEVIFTITVTNLSSQTATNIDIRNIVPNFLTYVNGSILGGDTNNQASPDAGSGLTWNIASLIGSASETLNFRATADAGSAANNPITNTVSLVSLNESEQNSANNDASVDINAKAFDVSIAKAPSNAVPEEGEEITYTITVTNTTPGVPGSNILIRDIVPNGVTYVPGSISAAHSPIDTAPDSTGLTWTIANLAGGANEVLTFRATVDSGAQGLGPNITNTAVIESSNEVDSIPGNNSASGIIVVTGLDMEVTKTVNIAEPIEGQEIIYTIRVRNTSSQTATNVRVRDIVPNGLTYVSPSINGGDSSVDSSPAGTGLEWTVNVLAGGAFEDLTFRASVDAGAISLSPITNTASLISIAESEDNAANNSGSIPITVKAFDVGVTKTANKASF
jgi:uncharacterized repeat protein (TIGR01451 family)